MNNANRRTFMKKGITAGTGLTLASVYPSQSSGGTKSLSSEFDVCGIKGTAFLELGEEVPEKATFNISIQPLTARKALAFVRFMPQERLVIKRFSVKLSIPLKDVNRIWYTQQLDGCGWHAYISLPWRVEIPASGHHGSLIAEVQNRYRKNRGLIAFKDQSGDGSLQFKLEYGGRFFHLILNRFATDRTYIADGIDETVYIDIEDVPWYKAVSQFVEWYDHEWKLTYNTPGHCYEPVFNTWYPVKDEQKEETILRFARKCSELGIKTFEIDAGWFKNAGTWEVNTEKIPDLRKTIRKIKSMGLKVTIWYRPFDSGGLKVEASPTPTKELEQYCTVVDGKSTGLLCPRCKEVQQRAGRIAGELMEKYDLDGLKIDFLDASTSAAPLVNCTADHEHACDFVSEGVRESMRVMADTIRKVKSDALIEYRLNYSNIANRQFANCYRGQDAPSDPDLVRRHLALLRSWSLGVAAHADYAYWTPDVSDKNISRFMAILTLYGVPTFSVDFEGLPESHFAIVRAWLMFYHEHKERLISGSFDPMSDDFHYSVARISSLDHTFIPVFLRHWPSTIPVLPACADNIFLFNGTSRPRILTRIEGAEGSYTMTFIDIMLHSAGRSMTITSRNGTLNLDNEVDIGGMVHLKRM